MAVMKVIEVLAQSDKSWMDDGKLNYRLDAKISFQIEPNHEEHASPR